MGDFKSKLKEVLPKRLWNFLRIMNRIIHNFYFRIKYQNSQKIFCIGLNKTGTTSMKAALKEMGFVVAPQRPAEKMIDLWAKRDFKKIVGFCKYAGYSFQDVPFSLPFTYVILDYFFPKSKFILTVRNNSEQWYNSVTKFHAKKWGKNGRIPTKEDLQNANYIYKGKLWNSNRKIFFTPESSPYKKDILIDYYENHNKNVKEYFRHRPDDLLVLNVSEKGAYKKLAKFFGVKTDKNIFPWENKT